MRWREDGPEHGDASQGPPLAPDQTLERFDWDVPITLAGSFWPCLFGPEEKCDNYRTRGGSGKPISPTRWAIVSAEGKTAAYATADNSFGKELISFLRPDFLILDDFGLKKLTPNLYEVIIERYGKSSTLITSTRHIEEWTSLFDDPLVANSLLDRLAYNAHQIVIDGDSYRKRLGITWRNE